MYALLSHLPLTFDIISFTEVWNNLDKNDSFHPISIEGYQKYNGLPGTTLKSGCGFYIKDHIVFMERPE